MQVQHEKAKKNSLTFEDLKIGEVFKVESNPHLFMKINIPRGDIGFNYIDLETNTIGTIIYNRPVQKLKQISPAKFEVE